MQTVFSVAQWEGVQRMASKNTEPMILTVNDPWELEIPQPIFDGIEQASVMTGLTPAEIVGRILVRDFESRSVNQKEATAKPANRALLIELPNIYLR